MRLRIDSPEEFLALLPHPHDQVGQWMGMAFELGGGVAINDRDPDKKPHGVLSLNIPRNPTYAERLAELFCGKTASYQGLESVQVRWGSYRALVLAQLMLPFAPSRRAELTGLIESTSSDPRLPSNELSSYEQIIQEPAAVASVVENKISLSSVNHRNFGFGSSNLALLEAFKRHYGGDIKAVAEAGSTFCINGSKITSTKDLWRWQISSRREICEILDIAKQGAFFKTDNIREVLERLVA